MSFDNPTSIQIGMTGAFSGITYRVLGRSVMGVVDGGSTYYWNEFNLQADDGKSATLVYEVGEHGGEWRLFAMFDPQFPITAADAATKRIGDPLNLDGTDVRVTLRDNSRVYYIEGQAPEGEDVGDRAEYFNAEAGKTMIVVSWTSDEVECYHGVTIHPIEVSQAFNIPAVSLAKFTLSGTNAGRSFSIPLIATFVLIGLFIGIQLLPVIPAFRPRSRPILRISAPPAKLPVGSSGNLEGKNYTMVSDALVEINEVGVVFQRHEFHLRDADGNGALLIHGWKPGAKDWCLLTLADPSEPMTPQQAAAVQSGQTVNADGAATVNALFRSTVVQVSTADILQSTTGHIYYGFSGENGIASLLARWDDDAVTWYKGNFLYDDPSANFARPAGK